MFLELQIKHKWLYQECTSITQTEKALHLLLWSSCWQDINWPISLSFQPAKTRTYSLSGKLNLLRKDEEAEETEGKRLTMDHFLVYIDVYRINTQHSRAIHNK